MKSDQRKQELVDGYCSGSLTDEKFAQFEDALRQDSELRRLLLEYRMLDSDLRSAASTDIQIAPNENESLQQGTVIRRLRIEVWAMAAVITLLLGGVTFLGMRAANPISTVEMEPSLDHGVAVLTQAIDAQWEGRQLRQGDSMEPGRWQLVEGTVELEFYSGASVILEAPAELEIVSANGGVLHAGKLRAQVPLHAHGFTITTKEIELVDLGTSFGMEVDSVSGTAVHVFDGKVELFEPDSERHLGEGHELLAGEGRIFNAKGEASDIRASSAGFLSPVEMDRKLQARLQMKYEQWQEAAEHLSEDSRLVAHYGFEREPNSLRKLSNRSDKFHEGSQGAIIGASWGSGRWPAKEALEFKRPGDRVRIDIPGEVSSMTLVVWLRIDGFDNIFHSLLLSDGWDRSGALHWQIHKDGFVELAVWHGESGETHNSRAPFEMRPSDFGRWTQLAVVYDGEKGTVTHYRDADLSAVVELPVVVPLAIGKAEIGNWTPPAKDSRQIRQFNGRMDEMMIFDEALTDKEISELYRNGKP